MREHPFQKRFLSFLPVKVSRGLADAPGNVIVWKIKNFSSKKQGRWGEPVQTLYALSQTFHPFSVESFKTAGTMVIDATRQLPTPMVNTRPRLNMP